MADQTLHQRLLAHLDDGSDPAALWYALRAVVEPHAPSAGTVGADGWHWCMGCAGLAITPWPCSTVQVIADQLGLAEEQDQKLIEGDERRG